MEEKEMVAEETAAEEKNEEDNTTANMAWIDFVTMLEELEYK